MIYKPSKEIEKFHLLLFIADNLLYFILGLLGAFLLPLLVGMFNEETLAVYQNENGGFPVFEIVCIILAVLFVAFMTVYKLNKSHMSQIIISGNDLILEYINLRGQKHQHTISLNDNRFKFVYDKPTIDTDELIEIHQVSPGKLLLSTTKSYYWTIKDRNTIKQLLFEIKEKCLELKIVTSGNVEINMGMDNHDLATALFNKAPRL